MKQTRIGLILAFAMATLLGEAGATAAPLIELTTAGGTFQGKSIARNDSIVYLMQRDGCLEKLPLKKITAYRKVGGQFSPFSAADVRDRLRREFGNEFEIVGTGHYLVCGPRQRARMYADIFEETYRTFRLYFGARGFSLQEPEFPLVALVFPDPGAFARYAREDGVTVSRGLRGYYLLSSNRIALFESEQDRACLPLEEPQGASRAFVSASTFRLRVSKHTDGPADWLFGRDEAATSLWKIAEWREEGEFLGSIEANLHDTIVHEATHQVGFNTGLQSRVGVNPLWVTEGLATLFEAPGIRNAGTQYAVSTRINRERSVWFKNFCKTRRKEKSLADFVATDSLFRTSPLDAYSQAWALTFFLVETRSRQYANFLQSIAARPALDSYSADARLADFQQAFGNDLVLLEAAFLRFMNELK